MSDSPDEIRADIERTRQDLGMDVDALADKVTPSKVADRQMAKVRGVFGRARERVMGVADDAGAAVSGAGSALADAGSHVGDVADRAKAKAEGNPLAVGLIAFGAGLLLASLIPASTKEKELAATVKDQAQPLVDEVTDVAKEMGEHLKEPAQHSMDAVKETAQESAETMRDQAQTAASEVRGQAQQAGEHLSES